MQTTVYVGYTTRHLHQRITEHKYTRCVSMFQVDTVIRIKFCLMRVNFAFCEGVKKNLIGL